MLAHRAHAWRPRPVRRSIAGRPNRLPPPVLAAPLADSVASSLHTLPDGTRLELLTAGGGRGSGANPAPPSRPPLLFVHGSGHAAWCWRERFLPHLAADGWTATAVSLRGRGGSDAPPAGARAGGTLASHAADVAHVMAAMEEVYGRSPIVVGHSFGGLVVQRLLLEAARGAFPSPSGAALLASAPPSGNSAMVRRIAAARGLWFSARLTWGFISRGYAKDAATARLMFFSDALADAEVERYVGLLAANDGATPVLDVARLGNETPLPPLGLPPPCPGFVLGGDADAVVDVGALREAAAWLGAGEPVILPGAGHDMMLDSTWRDAADALGAWAAGVEA